MKSEKPVALITGAGTGIRRSAALALARNGYQVIINFSRREEAATVTRAACLVERWTVHALETLFTRDLTGC